MDRSYRLSDRLGRITHSQLQAALDRFDLGQLLDVSPVRDGLFGQCAFLRTDESQWVFRGAPHWPWQFAKEQCFARFWHEETKAPVPWPYFVEESEEPFGWSFALMPRLSGVAWKHLEKDLSPQASCELAAVLGAGLAQLHSARVPATGEYDPATGGIAAETFFPDWVERGVREWQRKAAETAGAFEPADLDLIEGILADSHDALREPFEPCFVHYDYAGGNVLAEPTVRGWRVSGVVDLMTCAAGDGEQDLSRMAATLARRDRFVAEAFLAAYQERLPLRPGASERFRLYMLMDRLIFWDYGRRHGIWFSERDRFRHIVVPSLDLADAVS